MEKKFSAEKLVELAQRMLAGEPGARAAYERYVEAFARSRGYRSHEHMLRELDAIVPN